MPAASDLVEAKTFALQNVWGKYNAPSLLATSLREWINDGLIAVLNPNDLQQGEALGWTVPSALVLSRLPSATSDQNELQVAEVIEVLSRCIERLEEVDTLSGTQTTAIVDAYNSAWA